MKRFLILAALVAVALASVQDAQAQGRNISHLGRIKWVKADGSGNTTVDSTDVHMLFVAATNGSDPDTTATLDMARFTFPPHSGYVYGDSSTVGNVLMLYPHWDAEATTDTMRFTVQHSLDGTTWSTLKVVQIVGASNQGVDAYRVVNQAAAMDQARFIRAIALNYDKSTDAGTTGHDFWINQAVIQATTAAKAVSAP